MSISLIAATRQFFSFDIVENSVSAFARRRFVITDNFTDVNAICDARHISCPRPDLTTPHEAWGHNEHC
jgi:hypothetical protein